MENMDNYQYENAKSKNIILEIGILTFLAMGFMFAAGISYAFEAYVLCIATLILSFLIFFSILLVLRCYDKIKNYNKPKEEKKETPLTEKVEVVSSVGFINEKTEIKETTPPGSINISNVSDEIVLGNHCIICGRSSGFGMVCQECKDAVAYAKQEKHKAQISALEKNTSLT